MPQKYQNTKNIDKGFFYLIIGLTILGLVAVADASAPQAISVFNDRFYFVKQQGMWALLGIFAMIVASKINYKFWEKVALPFFVLSIILLLIVLLPQVGSKMLGARRWIFVGPISIQPSELIKFSLCLYLAKLSLKTKEIIPYLIPVGVVSILIMLEPDLGTTLIVASIGVVQMFLAEVNILKFVGSIIFGALAVFLSIITSSYRKERLLTFFQQTQDPLGKSYHIRQILLSLGLGGVFGVGLGASRQKYLFLPEAATDSIFAVIAEEVGFFGAALLIIILFYFVMRAFRISKNAPDSFSRLLSAGISTWIGAQIILNIGSVVALVPITGVPLPLFSYGGSSISTILMSLGILLNISRYETNNKKR